MAATASPSQELTLQDGSRVAVVGSGPAGSLFAYFLLGTAERAGTRLEVDLYDSRDFTKPAPLGCNMCGGIVSESLVQLLAAEGIELPSTVIQRGIDSYVLHMDVGTVRIDTPTHEMRIGAVHRGAGPRDLKAVKWQSFDGYLQGLALSRGARHLPERVDGVAWEDGRPRLATRAGSTEPYDLVAVATGVNSTLAKLFENTPLPYRPPETSKTFIREYFLGEETVERILGSSMHVFLLDIPRLEFAAIIPKGDYITVCLLGDEIDNELVDRFMQSPEVRATLPADLPGGPRSCQCSPRISVRGAIRPFADRMVFVGDCGVTRLYKDGIGAAYRTAKAAATTAVLQGVSEGAFRRHFWPMLETINRDNMLGRVTFAVTGELKKRRFTRLAIFRMVAGEQRHAGPMRRMSRVLWDVFTGSAPYRVIFLRTLHPAFVGRFLWHTARAALAAGRRAREEVAA